jgi:hypothetical protein
MRRAAQQEDRLADRRMQTHGWAAPVPDVLALPRPGEAPRVRAEWETRGTINHRLWADTMSAGAKTVTPAALAAHPTAGAEAGMPSSGRRDLREYGEAGATEWFAPPPGARPIAQLATNTPGSAAYATTGGVAWAGVQQRPAVPSHSLWQSSWLSGFDVEGAAGGVVRELRGVVREAPGGFAGEDAAGRFMSRQFNNQWLSVEDRQRIASRQMDAAAAMRPVRDDFERDYGGGMVEKSDAWPGGSAVGMQRR